MMARLKALMIHLISTRCEMCDGHGVETTSRGKQDCSYCDSGYRVRWSMRGYWIS
jgi:hypothetical protein